MRPLLPPQTESQPIDDEAWRDGWSGLPEHAPPPKREEVQEFVAIHLEREQPESTTAADFLQIARTLINHPDEEVAITAMYQQNTIAFERYTENLEGEKFPTDENWSPWGSPALTQEGPEAQIVATEIWKSATERAWKDTQSRGVVITPLMALLLSTVLEKYGRPEDGLALPQAPEGFFGEGTTEAHERIVAWAKTERDPQELNNLWRIDPRGLLGGIVAARTSLVSDAGNIKELAPLVCSGKGGEILSNPALTQSSLDVVVDEMIERITSNRIETINRFFAGLTRRGYRLTTSQVERLRKIATDNDPRHTGEKLVNIEEAYEDPKLREVMARSDSAAATSGLLKRLSGAKWVEIATIMAKSTHKNTHRLLAMALREAGAEKIEGASRAALVPLIAHEDDGVRTSARRLAALLKPTVTDAGRGPAR